MIAPSLPLLPRLRWVAAMPLLAVSVWLAAGYMAARAGAEQLLDFDGNEDR